MSKREMLFIEKSFYEYVKSDVFKSVRFQKPQTCPCCGINTDAKLEAQSNHKVSDDTIYIFAWRCTACNNMFVSLHLCSKKEISFIGIAPNATAPIYSDKELEEVSPRFIEMYNQAYRAEYNGDYDLAAVGYRCALEILVKDFAIQILKEAPETVSKLRLCAALKKYLDNPDMLKVADVVRLLGNDYTHYERKYPECDFATLKSYMEIFLNLIRTKIRIKNPPVSR